MLPQSPIVSAVAVSMAPRRAGDKRREAYYSLDNGSPGLGRSDGGIEHRVASICKQELGKYAANIDGVEKLGKLVFLVVCGKLVGLSKAARHVAPAKD